MKKIMITLCGFLISCSGGKNRTDSQWTTDMAKQNHVKAQEGTDKGEILMKLPPKGTQARNRRYYPYTRDPLKASAKLKNPLAVSEEVLKQGKTHYESFCIYCHGSKGDAGEGATVAPKMVIKPASLLSKKAKAYTDGRIYHIIYEGQGLMGAYQAQLETSEQALLSHKSKNFNREYTGSNNIWAVVHYVRLLQKSSAQKNSLQKDSLQKNTDKEGS